MEETVKELKADLKNARELIGFLTENMKTLKPARDEDLHRKLDEILNQRENQKELERKIDILREESRKDIETLREEIKKVADEVRNSKEMSHITDSVETSVGYLELFVKDFENIHSKMQEMDAENEIKFGEISREFEELNMKNGSILKEIANFGEKLENLKKDIPSLAEGQHLLMDKLDKLETEAKNTSNTILRIERRIMKNEEENRNSQKQEVNEGRKEKVENDPQLKKNEQKKEHSPERNYKCWNCHCVLAKNLQRKEDGVTVGCPKCGLPNIVRRLEGGYKWMGCGNGRIVGFFDDCQQYPIDTKDGEFVKCQICGKQGYLRERNKYMAISC